MQNDNPFASPLTAADAGLANQDSPAEVIRREHLSHEASIQSMGVLFLLGGIVGIMVTIVMLVTILSAKGQGDPTGKLIVLAIFGLVGAIAILQLWTALGLRKLRANTRIPAIVLSAISLINIPIGTLIGGYFLYLLLSAKGKYVFTEEYRLIREETPHIKRKTSKIVWVFLILLVVVVGLLAIALTIGTLTAPR